MFTRAHFKLSPADVSTSRGGLPWAVSPPPTRSKAMRQFEMYPFTMMDDNAKTDVSPSESELFKNSPDKNRGVVLC
jgi:hypothetical protein